MQQAATIKRTFFGVPLIFVVVVVVKFSAINSLV